MLPISPSFATSSISLITFLYHGALAARAGWSIAFVVGTSLSGVSAIVYAALAYLAYRRVRQSSAARIIQTGAEDVYVTVTDTPPSQAWHDQDVNPNVYAMSSPYMKPNPDQTSNPFADDFGSASASNLTFNSSSTFAPRSETDTYSNTTAHHHPLTYPSTSTLLSVPSVGNFTVHPDTINSTVYNARTYNLTYPSTTTLLSMPSTASFPDIVEPQQSVPPPRAYSPGYTRRRSSEYDPTRQQMLALLSRRERNGSASSLTNTYKIDIDIQGSPENTMPNA